MDYSKSSLLDKVLMEGINEILLVIRIDGDQELYYEYINKMAFQRTGLTRDDLGKALRTVHTKEDFDFFRSNHINVIRAKKEMSYEDSFLSPKGERFYSQSQLTPIFDENGDVQNIVVLVHDITSKKHAEQALKSSTEKLVESRDQFRIIAENTHDLIILISNEGIINFISPSCKELLEIDSNEFIGKLYSDFVHPDEQKPLKDAFNLSVKNKRPLKDKYRIKNNDGKWVLFEIHGSPVFNEIGVYSHFVAVSRDITTSHEYERKLKYFAYYDMLADVPNRRLFLQDLAEALENKQARGVEVALILLDIDKFKSINDTFGHDFGDLVIKEFARRLKIAASAEESRIARLGGDEFAVISPNIQSVEAAVSLATSILCIMRNPWTLQDRTLLVTPSIGLAMASAEDLTNATLFKKADIGLYEAKEAGRNCIRIYG